MANRLRLAGVLDILLKCIATEATSTDTPNRHYLRLHNERFDSVSTQCQTVIVSSPINLHAWW